MATGSRTPATARCGSRARCRPAGRRTAPGTGPGWRRGAGPGSMTRRGASPRRTMAAGPISATAGAGCPARSACARAMRRPWSALSAAARPPSGLVAAPALPGTRSGRATSTVRAIEPARTMCRGSTTPQSTTMAGAGTAATATGNAGSIAMCRAPSRACRRAVSWKDGPCRVDPTTMRGGPCRWARAGAPRQWLRSSVVI
ncbi:hypothetical protein D3C72_1722870 [compost metagenome]